MEYVLIAYGLFVEAGGFIGFVVTLVLVVMFGMRLAKTKKFMPSGMMLAVSIVVAGVLASMLLP